MKVNITLNDELVTRIDNYADNNYMSRSGLISLACTQFLNAAEVTFALQEMALAVKKIADTGSLDDETLKQLEDMERVAKFLSGK